MTSSEIRKNARESLTGKWGKGALITFCFFVIEFLINFIISGAKNLSPFLSSLLSIGDAIISVPLSYGLLISFIKLKRGEEVNAFDFFTDGFSNFGRIWGIAWNVIKKMILPIVLIIVTYVLLSVFVAFSAIYMFTASSTALPALLSIICSLALLALYVWVYIKSLLYSLVYQVSYDNPNFSSKEVVEQSERLMKGKRGDYFVLQLSFIGWALLACLTFGIGMFWLVPYISVATVCFYEALSGKQNTSIEIDTEKAE